MAGNKYLSIDATTGDLAEVAATQSSAGPSSAGLIVALDASGQINATMLPTTGSTTLTASEAIAAGSMINLWNNAGVINVRNADSATNKKAHGFVNGAIASSASGQVEVGNGDNTGVTGLTIGDEYFLSSAGTVTATVPTASGSTLQKVGVAQATNQLQVILGPAIKRA